MATHVAMPEILHDLHVTHTERRPVFVLGSGRSGTSMFAALLRKYMKINFGPETQFIVEYFKRLHTYGDLRNDANFRLLIGDIARERCFERWELRFGFQLDPERVATDARERTYSGILTAIFEQFAEFHRMARWGDKSPNYDRDLAVLLEIFPTARFIHVVRDGRDVALSLFRVFFGAKNAYRAAKDWRQQLLWIQAFKATLPPELFIEIRYEDLLQDPRATFARLIPFLEISDPDGRLLDFVATRIGEDLRPQNARKWPACFTRRQSEVFEAVAGDVLRAFGYPLTATRRIRLGPFSRAYYQCDNKIRKWLNWEYQQDNLYKIKLRLRQHTQPLRKALGRRRHAGRGAQSAGAVS